ncbi:hypothetical protein LUZ63_002258 [Rhynchospora breviuscula]|uniref:KIB1-4 beta-propeller domain-containing protein n=1 Tax=Rhynchospora breviuscula TaxID=2022672 RepID=A0A9Q0HXN6_9POAL|nr:hypothetical protein LUZ63_002258 [Rhynchospora breviuscula]
MPYQKKGRLRKEPKRKQGCANWAELNSEILHIIYMKLCDVMSFIMFCAVCKNWRVAADEISDCPRQFPCLIDWSGPTNLQVYSPASGRTHTFQVPDAYCCGPSGPDVLFRTDSPDNDLFYLNPLTKVKATFPFETSLDPISWHNSRNLDDFVLINESDFSVLYFKQTDKDEWTKKEFCRLTNAAYHNSKYFILKDNMEYEMVVIDKTNGAELPSVRFPNYDPPLDFSMTSDVNYLIATTNGLLLITGFIPLCTGDLNDCQFEVHRLGNYPQNPNWTKLTGIGDLMVFLDHSNCFALEASDYDGFKGNCIYFITFPSLRKRVIGRFDIGLNKTEELTGPKWFGSGKGRKVCTSSAWFVPSI